MVRLPLFFVGVFVATSLLAKPSGMEVKSGQARLCSPDSKSLVVHASKDAILHWNTFSTAKGEKVVFQQPSASSAVLNRVTGEDPSQLSGMLQSNGTVFLINPSGILIGPEGMVETAGFFASTAALSDESFLSGKELVFANFGEGEIVNQGLIRCPQGDIFLIAKTVSNEGTCHADHVGIAASQEVLIRPKGKRGVFIRPDLETVEDLAIELETASPYAKAINHEGTFKTYGVQEEEGRIYLVGKIEAPGGEVHLLGNHIHLTENAHIDVSGAEGGTVLIGGDFQGGNAEEIPHAQTVVMDKGAEIYADGLEGDGGKVILWGDEKAHYRGFISTQALGERGDGGLVEISSPTPDYVFAGRVNTLSKNGKVGMLFLDPSDITVGLVATSDLFNPPTTYNPAGVVSATLLNSDLVTALGTTSITIATSAGVGGSGDVTFSAGAPVSWTAAPVTTLTVTADRDVIVSADITASGGCSIDLNASRSVFIGIGSTVSTVGGGDITMNGNIASTAAGSFAGVQVSASAVVTSDTGTITLTGIGGTLGGEGIVVEDNATVSTTGIGGGVISLTGTGQTTVTSDGIEIQSGATISSAEISGGVPVGSISLVGTTAASSGGQGVLADAATISTVDAPLSIMGTATGGLISVGIQLSDTALVTSTGANGTGTITLNGTGSSNGDTDCAGVILLDTAGITTLDGDISITGVGGGDALGTDNWGVVFFGSGTMSSTGDGSITVDGTGGNGSDSQGIRTVATFDITSTSDDIMLTGSALSGSGTDCSGILIETSSLTTGGDGVISMTGTASVSGSDRSYGVFLEGTTVTTSDGTITIEGTGGGVGGSNFGVYLPIGTTVSSTGGTGPGTISITGEATGDGSDNVGIQIEGGADVTSTSGGVTLDGTGSSSGTGSCAGIRIENIGTTVTTVDGTIMMTGVGGGASGTDNTGIEFNDTSTVSSTSGSITLMGTGGVGSSSRGVYMETALTTGGAGNITITGLGALVGATTGCQGIRTQNLIEASSGTISLTGTGRGTDSCFGIRVSGNLRTTDSGPIILDGMSDGTGSDNRGLSLGGTIESQLGLDTGTGTITFTGNGSTAGTTGCDGVFSSARITSNKGDISITGEAGGSTITGADNHGIEMLNSMITSDGDGTITLEGTGGSGTLGANNGIQLTGQSDIDSNGAGTMSLTGTGGEGDGFASGTQGIILSGSSVDITTTSADISLTGTGMGTGSDAGGVGFLSGASVVAGGSGMVTVVGNGSSASANNNIEGVLLNGLNSRITSESGAITITANGNATGTNVDGFRMEAAAFIESLGGAISITGMAGAGGDLCDGIFMTGASTEIEATGGSITLEGTGMGTGATCRGIALESSSDVDATGVATVTFMGTGSASGSSDCHGIAIAGIGVDVRSVVGAIDLTGVVGGGSSTNGILISLIAEVGSTGGASISMTTTDSGDLSLLDGAEVLADGSGTITLDVSRDLFLTGGAAASRNAVISPTNGLLSVTTGRDCNLTGGTIAGALAQIGNSEAPVGAASGSIELTIGRNLNITAPDNTTFAILGHGDPTAAQTLSGSVTGTVGGSLTLTGATAGASASGFAQLGHVDRAAGGSTIGGDIDLTIASNITITGGTTADAYARIGHGGQAGGGTFDPSTLLLKSGANTTLATMTGEAQIANLNGPVTLVVDNLFPTPPDIGPGEFNLSSLIFSSGELRIYTASRDQNTITDPSINGAIFIPGPSGVDSATEKWSVYFPGGVYGGGAFTIYYKDSGEVIIIIPEQAAEVFFGDIAANLTALADLLPFSFGPPTGRPPYHFKVCEDNKTDCSPDFSPYGSFIFEDDLYWIGERY